MKTIEKFIYEKLKINSKSKINYDIINITDLKCGDIIKYTSALNNNIICIFNKYTKKYDSVHLLGTYDYDEDKFYSEAYTWSDKMSNIKYASQEEIDELMEIIDKNGYRYNVKGPNNIEVVKK